MTLRGGSLTEEWHRTAPGKSPLVWERSTGTAQLGPLNWDRSSGGALRRPKAFPVSNPPNPELRLQHSRGDSSPECSISLEDVDSPQDSLGKKTRCPGPITRRIRTGVTLGAGPLGASSSERGKPERLHSNLDGAHSLSSPTSRTILTARILAPDGRKDYGCTAPVRTAVTAPLLFLRARLPSRTSQVTGPPFDAPRRRVVCF